MEKLIEKIEKLEKQIMELSKQLKDKYVEVSFYSLRIGDFVHINGNYIVGVVTDKQTEYITSEITKRSYMRNTLSIDNGNKIIKCGINDSDKILVKLDDGSKRNKI